MVNRKAVSGKEMSDVEYLAGILLKRGNRVLLVPTG